MPLLTADPVTVLPGQREALEQLVRTHSTPQQVALRARIILHAVEGMEVRKSARELGVWPKTARYWRKRWQDADGKCAVCERLADQRSAGSQLLLPFPPSSPAVRERSTYSPNRSGLM